MTKVDEMQEVKEMPKKKRKRLAKTIEGTVLTIVEGNTDTTLVFDFSTLPENIQTLLGPFGLSQKIGDAAAGKKDAEAVNAMNKVWSGLMDGNWSVRAPAAEKVSKKSILEKYNAMPEGEEKVMAGNLLTQLGITS